MIYGLVAEWQKHKRNFPAIFDKAFAFLEHNDPALLADGEHPIDGDTLFMSIASLRTKDESLLRFEAHRKYIDIQIPLSGREKFLCAPSLAGMNVAEDLYAASDIAFYTPPASHSSLILDPGHFVVFFPGEAHCPCCAVTPGGEDLRKVVFKILWTD